MPPTHVERTVTDFHEKHEILLLNRPEHLPRLQELVSIN